MSHHNVPLSSLQNTIPTAPVSTGQRPSAKTVADAEIAERAYAKYEARGRVDGFDLEDWVAASRELTGDTLGTVRGPSNSAHRQ